MLKIADAFTSIAAITPKLAKDMDTCGFTDTGIILTNLMINNLDPTEALPRMVNNISTNISLILPEVMSAVLQGSAKNWNGVGQNIGKIAKYTYGI